MRLLLKRPESSPAPEILQHQNRRQDSTAIDACARSHSQRERKCWLPFIVAPVRARPQRRISSSGDSCTAGLFLHLSTPPPPSARPHPHKHSRGQQRTREEGSSSTLPQMCRRGPPLTSNRRAGSRGAACLRMTSNSVDVHEELPSTQHRRRGAEYLTRREVGHTSRVRWAARSEATGARRRLGGGRSRELCFAAPTRRRGVCQKSTR